ncbi:GntR family transcriptional regulator [Anoxynatronum buryatiense]|uniref:GntR family transcriptional regulator n=2 Tax=Anoxynatronum TaxID=210622 RepID=A0AA45WVV3_9CLOT|nr:GntR family transcriptional regulator [Anoxynatronum buryatiense]
MTALLSRYTAVPPKGKKKIPAELIGIQRGEAMLQLDLRSRQPIYEQLIEKIKELIITEVWRTDDQLPSVRALAQQLTINPNTIQKAYRELEREGFIYTVKGRGNFVAPIDITMHREKLAKIQEEIARLLAEAMYLGMTKEKLMHLVHQAAEQTGGEQQND